MEKGYKKIACAFCGREVSKRKSVIVSGKRICKGHVKDNVSINIDIRKMSAAKQHSFLMRLKG